LTRLGVDVGGTKIEAIALAPDGTEQARLRVPTPRGDYAATLAAIADLVARVAVDADPGDPVGVGIPGTLSPATGLVKNANTVWLNGQPLDRDLARALGRPVRVANDANCFAVSEARDGAGAGARTVFGVILGTGVGGGVVVDGRVLAGANAVAGEWGHNPLPWPRTGEWPGPPCYCGRAGCIETFLSGPALARDYAAGGGGETLDPAAIAARAEAGDARAAAALGRHEDRLARALATVINLLDPDVIVLGGGLSNLTRLYAAVPARWADWVFSDRVVTPLRRHLHGDASGVRGAAWLWVSPAG
jgi:fructokinase